MIHTGEEITIPIYLMRGNALFASSEVKLFRASECYTGFVELEANFIPGEVILVDNCVTIPLYLVHGAYGERTPVGDLKMILQRDSHWGGFVNVDILHEGPMSTARSLTNQEY